MSPSNKSTVGLDMVTFEMGRHMSNIIMGLSLRALAFSSALCGWRLSEYSMAANPVGGTVAQGIASFSSSGSQLTINQTSANAYINWQSFNIGAGETTTFLQPSSTSLVWNQINDPNPSQILGNLNANGYVVLQNSSGFVIGGQAAITAHGLVMTTASSPAPTLSGGGAWEFDAPPPTAKIFNFGQINITGGGSAFLLASDIENDGIISAPAGNIGLYAGEKVLISSVPDGRGLSAVVTLPQGSVDNNGKLIADAGSIMAQAQTVNQNGLVQANSVQEVNGTIELLASDSVNLGASSVISAKGDNTGVSAGGSVTIKSADNFADQAGSVIDISGGAQGGNGGQVEISAPQMSVINSSINGQAVSGFISGELSIDPLNIVLGTVDGSASDPNSPYSGTVASSDPPASGTLYLNVNDFSSTLSQINLSAIDNISLNTLWSLADATGPSTMTLTAGNSIVLNDNAAIIAGNNWNVTLNAGSGFVPAGAQSKPSAGSISSPSYGIYLGDSAFVQSQNGNLTLNAANEVQIAADANAGDDGIRTLGGGSIAVTTTYGDVNAGANPVGYQYEGLPGRHQAFLPPYYSVSTSVGGISTAAGGNVTIQAGGNVFSDVPSGSTVGADAGTGAFGSEPGNVTITAGGSVYGDYVLANGTGLITAGQNVGAATSGANSFALSLISGSWSVNAPHGSINLQEVRNPRGDFDSISYGSVAAFTFDYSAQASVTLDAGIGVDLTDVSVPRLSSAPQDQVPVVYPPILDISAGSGGVTLQGDVALFPSVDQSLNITTTAGGNFVSAPNTPGTTPELLMSDSSQISWSSANNAFSDTAHSTGLPVQAGDPNPVNIHINGNMENINLITSEATQLQVDGNMIGCGFSGQNLHASDVTSITVGGQIYNRGPYDFVYGINDIPAVPATDLLVGMGSSWENIFTLAVDPAKIASLTVPANTLDSQLAGYALQTASLFGVAKLSNGQLQGNNPGFVYDQATGQFGFAGDMSSLPASVLTALTTGSISILHLVNGVPVMDTNPGDNSPGRTYGQFETDTVSWVNPAAIQTLEQASAGAPSPENPQLGYRVGGPGLFTVNASSIDLGNTYGIISCGVYDPQGGYYRYADLASITPSGATLDVTVAADQTGTVVVDGTTIAPHDSLSMLTSTIAAIGGGNVNVNSTDGAMDLGSADLFGNETRDLGFGIFTSGNGDVNVTADGDINIDGSRIASYNGGNIFIESLQGNVDAGNGGASYIQVPVAYVNPANGEAAVYREAVFGSGIVADTLIDPSQVPNSAVVPGNITVKTPQGDIIADLGGILQEALNGNVSAGPTITLVAGTPPSGTLGQPGYSPGYAGNIDLGQSGVIGGTVNATANGNITGLVISRQNSDINAAQNFSGAVLSGGSANVSGGGSVSGVIVGVSGATVTGAGGVSAQVLSQNANVGGVAQNTLGATATATATSQSAAGQASSDSKQQLASNDTGADDDEKKKKKMQPLMRRIKRVTVILPRI